MSDSDDDTTIREWWAGLNDTWSKDPVTYLTVGKSIDGSKENQFVGDFIFHRFFGMDDDNPKDIKVVLVEAQKWTNWMEWLEKNKVNKTRLLPSYTVTIETMIMSRKSFRIIQWVDEYRPYDFFPEY